MKTKAYQVLCWTFLAIISRVICQKTKTSIFDSKPIRVQDYGAPPVTSTIPLYDCSGSHRPKLDIPGAYEVYHDKQWYLQTCQEGLTWNQTLCRCEFPNGRPLVVQCRDYRSTSTEPTGKYEQLVNGQWIVRDCSLAVAGLVWDQEACQCVWGPDSKEMVTGQGIAPCEIMLNMTFENGVKDEAKGSYVEVGRGNPVPIFAVNKRDAPDGYKAAYFSETALNIWYFAGNEMGTSLRVEFRFKMTNDPIQREKYQIFLSNGCNISSPGYTTPSLAIGYRAADQSYLLAFETATARKAIVCTRKLGAYDWHTISLIYEDGTLLFRVDKQPCIISQDFSGPVQKTPCPLTIGADPLERESMYKGYLDNLLIARYCRRFIDTDPNGSNDKTKGPMPVETAPTVSEFSFQQIRPKSDRQSSRPVSSRKQRAVTSTKYLPQLPRILKSGVQSVEPRAETGDFLETSMGAEEKTHSFLRFPRSGDESHDSFQGETSEQEQGNEFTRHDTTNDQEGDYNQEKQDGESDNFDSLDVNSKQDNNYGTHVKTQEQADTGRAKSKKNADSRKGNNNFAKIVGKSREQSSETDEATSQSSDTRHTTRQTNSNKKYRKVEENDSHFQHSKQTGRKGQRYTHANSNDASTSSTENNEEEKRPVNAQEDENQDYQGNDNPKENGKHRNKEQPRNDWFPLNNRRGGKYESNNTDKKRKVVTSRENRKEENGNTSRGYKKAEGKSEGMERFKRTDESEGNVKKSGRTSSNYERNGRRDVQKTHEYDSNIKKVVNINDDDELSDDNGKSKNNKQGNSAGYRKNDASEKPDSFDGYNKERDFNNERNNGFKSYSENTWKDDDNVDTYSIEKTKEEGEITDSNEDYDYSQQTNGGGHEVEKKRMGRTNRDKPHDKRKEKKKEGSRHVRVHTEQRQLYKGNAREKEVSNLGTQEKEPSESGVYFDSFEGNKKERYDSDFRSNAEPKLTSKMAAMNEDKYVKLGVSNTHDALEDRIWNNDKKFKDSEEEDSNVGQNLAKSRPIRHDRGGISKLDNQQIIAETSSGKETNFDTSSRETVSNLVKGRRRSGSKKKNWYDKTDVARSRHQESLNSDEQKPLVEQNKKPVSAQRAVDTENKRSGKVEIVYSDIHNIEYDQSITDDKHSDPPKSKNEKFDHQSIHTFDNPDNINFGKVLRKPAAHGFIVKDYIENYEEDDELDQRAQANDNGRVSHESTDKTTKSAKDPAQQASNSGQILPKSKNLEPVKTLTNDQKNKNTKGNEQVKDKGESHNEEKNTSLSTQKDEQEPEVASDNHFNMPVDVTKIASSRSALVASNISQERTPNLADPTKQSPAPIETGKPFVH